MIGVHPTKAHTLPFTEENQQASPFSPPFFSSLQVLSRLAESASFDCRRDRRIWSGLQEGSSLLFQICTYLKLQGVSDENVDEIIESVDPSDGPEGSEVKENKKESQEEKSTSVDVDAIKTSQVRNSMSFSLFSLFQRDRNNG